MSVVDGFNPKILYINLLREEDFLFEEMLGNLPRLVCSFDRMHSIDLDQLKNQDSNYDAMVLRVKKVAEDTYDLFKHLKTHSNFIPIILIANEKEGEEDLEVISSGATDFLLAHELTPPLLERSIKFSLCRSKFRTELKERDLRILMNERLVSVGLLASGMAHEIGTPLGVIRGRAEVLLLRNKGNEILGRDLGIIIGQVDRISKLMKSLLNLARGDESRRTGVIDVGGVVEEVLEVMRATFRLHEIRVFTEIPMTLHVRAQADHDPFHQILCNLFQNSIQAIDRAREAGKTGPHEIKISLQSEDDSWVLSVSDTGCGIAPEEKAKLFRPFFSTKGIGGGLGLGLALTHRIVESWRGMITVESNPGEGAVFHLKLPKEISIPS